MICCYVLRHSSQFGGNTEHKMLRAIKPQSEPVRPEIAIRCLIDGPDVPRTIHIRVRNLTKVNPNESCR
jgi:hypothetical protein